MIVDLNTITEVRRSSLQQPGIEWQAGDRWLAGGTYVFSAPQTHLRRLVDLGEVSWEPLTVTPESLGIAATCTIANLYQFEPSPDWLAGPLIQRCCDAFLAGYKIWNSATVGGNICLSLPAGPMTSLAVALEASLTIWAPDGGIRSIDAIDFVTGDNANVLGPGELLREIEIPVGALCKRFTTRRLSLTKLGRSSVFLIGTLDPNNDLFVLTVTAATIRPIRLRFEGVPGTETLKATLSDAIPDSLYFDDPNGTPAHRKHLTHHFAQQIRDELARTKSRG